MSAEKDRFRVNFEHGMSVCIQVSARLLGSLDPDPSLPLLLTDLRECLERMNNEYCLRSLHGPEMDDGGTLSTDTTPFARAASRSISLPGALENSIRSEEIESLKESFETMAQLSTERANEVASLRRQVGELKDQLRFAHQNMARLEAASQADAARSESAEIRRLEGELRRLQATPPSMVRESELLSVLAEMSTVDGAVRHLHGEIEVLQRTNAGLVSGMQQLDGDVERLQLELQAREQYNAHTEQHKNNMLTQHKTHKGTKYV